MKLPKQAQPVVRNETPKIIVVKDNNCILPSMKIRIVCDARGCQIQGEIEI